MQLVWRLFGYVLVLLWLQQMQGRSAFVFVAESAAGLDALAAAGRAATLVSPVAGRAWTGGRAAVVHALTRHICREELSKKFRCRSADRIVTSCLEGSIRWCPLGSCCWCSWACSRG